MVGINGQHVKVQQAWARSELVAPAFDVIDIAPWDAKTNVPCLYDTYYNITQQSMLDIQIRDVAGGSVSQRQLRVPSAPDITVTKCWDRHDLSIICWSNFSCSFYNDVTLQTVILLPNCEVSCKVQAWCFHVQNHARSVSALLHCAISPSCV